MENGEGEDVGPWSPTDAEDRRLVRPHQLDLFRPGTGFSWLQRVQEDRRVGHPISEVEIVSCKYLPDVLCTSYCLLRGAGVVEIVVDVEAVSDGIRRFWTVFRELLNDTLDDADGNVRGALVTEGEAIHLQHLDLVATGLLPQESVEAGVFGGEADPTEHRFDVGCEGHLPLSELDQDFR